MNQSVSQWLSESVSDTDNPEMLTYVGPHSGNAGNGDVKSHPGGGGGFYNDQVFVSSHLGSASEALLNNVVGNVGGGHSMVPNVEPLTIAPTADYSGLATGASDDVKDLSIHGMQAATMVPGSLNPASMANNMESGVGQGLLAKPVPMRRLSEKCIAHARANMASDGMINSYGVTELTSDPCPLALSLVDSDLGWSLPPCIPRVAGAGRCVISGHEVEFAHKPPKPDSGQDTVTPEILIDG
ncbi:hypothetical protein LSH36_622g01016 [Paralvinella palmiformis]|uniref:Uncharacterized protein n=1 Tax=Paralvinella palmiformis TaxID=53620 RepID=A0AAD9MW31_9ANNE|nr:hypothetical protein LSH36_622g01016 [Paralvinella palmiformis]